MIVSRKRMKTTSNDKGRIHTRLITFHINEASPLKLEVFSELHTLAQFEEDSKPILPLLLAGQNNLLDKLY